MSGAVIVGNVRKPVPDGYTRIYVGRASSYRPEYGEDFSVLGNPYTMPKYTRKEAIEEYRRHARPVYATPDIRRPFVFLELRLKAGEKLALMCFCHPQNCHADVIKELLEAQP